MASVTAIGQAIGWEGFEHVGVVLAWTCRSRMDTKAEGKAVMVRRKRSAAQWQMWVGRRRSGSFEEHQRPRHILDGRIAGLRKEVGLQILRCVVAVCLQGCEWNRRTRRLSAGVSEWAAVNKGSEGVLPELHNQPVPESGRLHRKSE